MNLISIGGEVENKNGRFTELFDMHNQLSHGSGRQGEFQVTDFGILQSQNAKQFYIFGGKDKNGVSSNIMVFDLHSHSWRDAGFYLSKPKSNVSVVSCQGKVYVCGGRDQQNQIIDECEIIDLISKQTIQIVRMRQKRCDFKLVTSYDDEIYAFGGQGENLQPFLNKCEKFNGIWQDIPSMINRRAGLNAIQIDKFFYIFGGFDGKKFLNSVEKYDPNLRSWSFLSFMSKPKAYFSITKSDDKNYIYILGGISNGEPLDQIERFDIQNNDWDNWGQLSQTRYKHYSYMV